MQQAILPRVIFSPAVLALGLVEELARQGVEVTLYTPGKVEVSGAGVVTICADLSGFEAELAARGDDYLDLLKKHPLTFVTLARQVQAELVARAYADANAGRLDVVHIYTNEEELALVMARFCQRPVVFTHHDPYNFLVRYRSVMPNYAALNWISLSLAQRRGMPGDTNWVGNVYHGLAPDGLRPVAAPSNDYVAYLGRIIEPKGVHLAIGAVRQYNRCHPESPLKLRIAGKHYGSSSKDTYWTQRILPELGPEIEYVGFVADAAAKRQFLGNARALLVPSVFDEPFGLVQIEALACGTPVIGVDSGAIAEVITDGKTGFVVAPEGRTESEMAAGIVAALERVDNLKRANCRTDFENRFTVARMAAEYAAIYQRLMIGARG